ncbi:MAG: cupin domain-containing protein [Acetobacteraceae bacterium]|nr:cupin domain-containing protein [Acetobacteraceae bacterium]
MSEDASQVHVVQPGDGRSFWQPVPANGFIDVLMAPDMVAMETKLGFGRQTVAPGCYVREHAHDRNEELIHVVAGRGRAVIEGVDHVMQPGSTFFLGRNRRHMFVNEGADELVFLWLILPNGLETFFAAIGREKRDGAPDPTPFPRPADVLAIEARTVFAPPPPDGGRKP